jgi:hypothetical protein
MECSLPRYHDEHRSICTGTQQNMSQSDPSRAPSAQEDSRQLTWLESYHAKLHTTSSPSQQRSVPLYKYSLLVLEWQTLFRSCAPSRPLICMTHMHSQCFSIFSARSADLAPRSASRVLSTLPNKAQKRRHALGYFTSTQIPHPVRILNARLKTVKVGLIHVRNFAINMSSKQLYS